MKEPCSPALQDVEITWTGKCAEKGGGGGEEGGGSGGPPLITTGFDNSMPQIRNPVDRINVMAGELLQYQVRYWIFFFFRCFSHERRHEVGRTADTVWFELAGICKE